MQVLRNDGLYRHLRFKSPGTCACYFDLVTWPGYLAYSGDMGCYVFTRIEDMFSFFRRHTEAEETLPINPRYWHEKLEGIDRNAGVTEYCADKFKEALLWELRVKKEGGSMPEDREKRHELFQELRQQVWDLSDEGDVAIRAACEFEHEGFSFSDFYEHNCTTYTTRYLWCCYALVWAIGKYDAAMQKTQEAA